MNNRQATAALVALCSLLAVASAASTRSLLQQTSCVNLATSAASGACQDFVALQPDFPPSNATDAQIQKFMDSHEHPSTACCAVAGQLVTMHCQCDATVQQFAGLYNLSPGNLVTFARAAKLSCGPTYIANSINPYCS